MEPLRVDDIKAETSVEGTTIVELEVTETTTAAEVDHMHRSKEDEEEETELDETSSEMSHQSLNATSSIDFFKNMDLRNIQEFVPTMKRKKAKQTKERSKSKTTTTTTTTITTTRRSKPTASSSSSSSSEREQKSSSSGTITQPPLPMRVGMDPSHQYRWSGQVGHLGEYLPKVVNCLKDWNPQCLLKVVWQVWSSPNPKKKVKGQWVKIEYHPVNNGIEEAYQQYLEDSRNSTFLLPPYEIQRGELLCIDFKRMIQYTYDVVGKAQFDIKPVQRVETFQSRIVFMDYGNEIGYLQRPKSQEQKSIRKVHQHIPFYFEESSHSCFYNNAKRLNNDELVEFELQYYPRDKQGYRYRAVNVRPANERLQMPMMAAPVQHVLHPSMMPMSVTKPPKNGHSIATTATTSTTTEKSDVWSIQKLSVAVWQLKKPGNDWQSFDSRSNWKVEQAYQQKKKQCVVSSHSEAATSTIVDFRKMKRFQWHKRKQSAFDHRDIRRITRFQSRITRLCKKYGFLERPRCQVGNPLPEYKDIPFFFSACKTFSPKSLCVGDTLSYQLKLDFGGRIGMQCKAVELKLVRRILEGYLTPVAAESRTLLRPRPPYFPPPSPLTHPHFLATPPLLSPFTPHTYSERFSLNAPVDDSPDPTSVPIPPVPLSSGPHAHGSGEFAFPAVNDHLHIRDVRDIHDIVPPVTMDLSPSVGPLHDTPPPPRMMGSSHLPVNDDHNDFELPIFGADLEAFVNDFMVPGAGIDLDDDDDDGEDIDLPEAVLGTQFVEPELPTVGEETVVTLTAAAVVKTDIETQPDNDDGTTTAVIASNPEIDTDAAADADADANSKDQDSRANSA